MTYKDALKEFRDSLESGHALMPSHEAWLKAVESLEKADRYRWHDLRKDPEDLPKHEGYYLCKCGTGSWEYRVMLYEIIDGYNKEADRWRDREIGMVFNHFIIAWREIEPFEEVGE